MNRRVLRPLLHAGLPALLLLILSACGANGTTGSPLPAQPNSAPSQTTPSTGSGTMTVAISSADTAAASTISTFKYHVFAVHANAQHTMQVQSVRHPQSLNYPADLLYFGGPVVSHAISHNIYVDCTSKCFGDPQLFLDNLNNSPFIHIVDQYVGSKANARYMVGANISASASVFTGYLSEGDLVALIHAAASKYGSGYSNIYHIFLPSGVDTCFDQTTHCYSPDNMANFTFCAYHASGTFSDKVGHVLFTVIPYQDVPGCQIEGGPNSALVDSTDSAVSHETFETLTDPDSQTGWYNLSYNSEIADLCQTFGDTDSLQGRPYMIQEEYSNKVHACTNEP